MVLLILVSALHVGRVSPVVMFLFSIGKIVLMMMMMMMMMMMIINFQLLPGALQIALEEDLEFRQGLPLNYLNFMGVANSELVSYNN